MNFIGKRTKSAVLFFAFAVIQMTAQVQIHVSPSGDDSNDGSYDNPVATFARAQQLARNASSSSEVEVIFADGIYYLDNWIEFTEADNKSKVTYRAEHEGCAVISGGIPLNLNWQEYKDGIYVADVDGIDVIDQLYVNGKRQRMARFPNAVEGKNVWDVWDLNHWNYDASKDPLNSNRIASWSDPTGGYLHAMHELLWGDMHWQILGKNSDGSLNMEGGWQNNRQAAIHGTFRFVENIFEELDAPEEWYYDSKNAKLYYMPTEWLDLANASIEAARLEMLIHFDGSSQHPIKNIGLEGFVFRHVARTFMNEYEPLLRSDW